MIPIKDSPFCDDDLRVDGPYLCSYRVETANISRTPLHVGRSC